MKLPFGLGDLTARMVAVAGGVVLASALAAFAVIFAVARGAGPEPRVTTAPPATATTARAASPSATGSADATLPYTIESTLPPGMTPEDVAADRAGGPIASAQALVAYVKDGRLMVAEETGSNERVIVADWPGGVYALSPDRRHIAYATPDETRTWAELFVAPVGGVAKRVSYVAKSTTVGWFPDGRRLAATVLNVKGDSVTARRLGVVSVKGGPVARFTFDGRDPRVSPSGRQLVFLRSVSLQGKRLLELCRCNASGEGVEPVMAGVDVSSAAWLDEKTLIVAERGSWGRAGRLLRVRPDGTGVKELATAGSGGLTSLNQVLVGGESGLIAYDVVGDDGYSRIYTIRADGLSHHVLPGNRDVYPLMWSVDGDRIFYIEGNVSQGDPTALVSATPLGTAKHFVVLGARR